MKFLAHLIWAGLLFGNVGQAATLDIQFDSALYNGNVGDTINTVLGGTSTGVESLDTVSLLVSFDNSVVNASSVSITAPWTNFFGPAYTIDNTAGTVDIELNTFATITTPYNFATIAFLAVGNGNSPLTLAVGLDANVGVIGGVAGQTLNPNFTNSQIQIGAVPIPAAAWLMLSGAALLGLIGRRKRDEKETAAV